MIYNCYDSNSKMQVMIGSQSSLKYPSKYKMKRKFIENDCVISDLKQNFTIINKKIISSVIILLCWSVLLQNNIKNVGCESQIQSYFGDDPSRNGFFNRYSSSNLNNNNNGLTLDTAAFKQGIVRECLQKCPDQVCICVIFIIFNHKSFHNI